MPDYMVYISCGLGDMYELGLEQLVAGSEVTLGGLVALSG